MHSEPAALWEELRTGQEELASLNLVLLAGHILFKGNPLFVIISGIKHMPHIFSGYSA